MTKIVQILMLRRSPVNVFLRLSTLLWTQLPFTLQNTRPMHGYGTLVHKLVCRHAKRQQFPGTFFFRNRPELELIRRLMGDKREGSTVNIAVLGCSIGAEVYSILATIRTARPEFNVHVSAVDNSAEVLRIAKDGVYTAQTSELVGTSIFERITDKEFEEMFEGDRRAARIRPSLRQGIRWYLSDVGDPGLKNVLGPQDFVVASNFLCHMEPAEAESCLLNIAGIVKPGGYLFVTGVDINVRAKVAREQRWQPVPELIKEIHDGDPSVRRGWPCSWWGLEPLDATTIDWQTRYAAAFRLDGRWSI